jgi:hypothetical protein
MTPQQEEDCPRQVDRAHQKAERKYPKGYVAPWWELSPVTVDLLIKKGIKYDHSLMHNDFVPYYVRTGDTWTRSITRSPLALDEAAAARQRPTWSRSPAAGTSTISRR